MTTIASATVKWPYYEPGAIVDGRRVETVRKQHALVYYGRGDYRVIPSRPIVCTTHDVIAKVLVTHRCGTDVKIFQSGRPDQAEESLLLELAQLVGSTHSGDSTRFLDYVRLLQTGGYDSGFVDALYQDVYAATASFDAEDRAALWGNLSRYWGRIFGHETTVQVVRVGSCVHELSHGIGYMQGESLSSEYLNFQIGERCTLQSRIAHYLPPAISKPGTRGIQLLGGNITDLAMNQGGAFAQYVRIRPEVIQSGSIIRLPETIDDVSAALVEPLACLLDCFQKTAHEIGQDELGSILRKGVFPGGNTLVVGSGSMAMMAAMLALSDDPVIKVGGARRVIVAVRSASKQELVLKILNDPRVSCIICEQDDLLPEAVASHFNRDVSHVSQEAFAGFDDIILAAGTADTVASAHKVMAPTGARIMTFAGTRGTARIESGIWHYGNAGVIGTSGCNTKMMEIAVGLLSRGSINLRPLSGRTYTFTELQEGGTSQFFTDQYLRPKLEPNADLPALAW